MLTFEKVYLPLVSIWSRNPKKEKSQELLISHINIATDLSVPSFVKSAYISWRYVCLDSVAKDSDSPGLNVRRSVKDSSYWLMPRWQDGLCASLVPLAFVRGHEERSSRCYDVYVSWTVFLPAEVTLKSIMQWRRRKRRRHARAVPPYLSSYFFYTKKFHCRKRERKADREVCVKNRI